MIFDFLRQVPLFRDLPDDELEALCTKVEEIQLGVGEVLFEEGSLGDRAYVIQEGCLEVFKTSQGREILLANREVGEVIGEMALLEESTRMASVRARETSQLISIRKEIPTLRHVVRVRDLQRLP